MRSGRVGSGEQHKEGRGAYVKKLVCIYKLCSSNFWNSFFTADTGTHRLCSPIFYLFNAFHPPPSIMPLSDFLFFSNTLSLSMDTKSNVKYLLTLPDHVPYRPSRSRRQERNRTATMGENGRVTWYNYLNADSQYLVGRRFVFVRLSYVTYFYIEISEAVHIMERAVYRSSFVPLSFVGTWYVWKKISDGRKKCVTDMFHISAVCMDTNVCIDSNERITGKHNSLMVLIFFPSCHFMQFFL